jgi:hypothetical protein
MRTGTVYFAAEHTSTQTQMPLKLKQKGVRESTPNPNEMNGDNTAQGLYSDSDGLSLELCYSIVYPAIYLGSGRCGWCKKNHEVWSWFLTHKEVPLSSA